MITLDEARDLLRRAVDTQGADFAYRTQDLSNILDSGPACRYEPMPADKAAEGDPRVRTGCLIGTALTLAGETRHLGFEGSVANLAHEYPDMMTHDAAEYFHPAQVAQDGGETWGRALAAAEWRYSRL